ncbi:conodipine-P1 [Hydra vulgaris]|uniref:Conodipine-P1 n=1 Tax=Hydra vulgaris TaxID=6087 RepID=A0ABM4C4N8_HYDVU
MILFYLLASSLMMTAETTDADKKCLVTDFLNGCSTPFHLPLPYKAMFTPACMTHDVCYRCGIKHGWSQIECDLRFKTGMINLCKKNVKNATRKRRNLVGLWESMKDKYERVKNGWGQTTANQTVAEEAKRLWSATQEIFKMVVKWFSLSDEMEKCVYAADIYYYGVASYGIYAYRTSIKSDCNEDCVKELGSNLHN